MMNRLDECMDRIEHEKDAKVTNLVWEIAKILNPDSYIEPNLIERAKNEVRNILKKKE
tara:strand:- start:644 stop:817 length:174 start_codon:yes stop_codon:yes gene_type:complete